MNLVKTAELNEAQKKAVHALWNEEYPVQIKHDTIADLEEYLGTLSAPMHYLLYDDAVEINGWAFTFDREGARWFAIIVAGRTQKRGIGAYLLSKLKEDATVLNGWAADHNNDLKENGEPYLSPIGFYEKNGFSIHPDIRLKTDKLSVIKISWAVSH